MTAAAHARISALRPTRAVAPCRRAVGRPRPTMQHGQPSSRTTEPAPAGAARAAGADAQRPQADAQAHVTGTVVRGRGRCWPPAIVWHGTRATCARRRSASFRRRGGRRRPGGTARPAFRASVARTGKVRRPEGVHDERAHPPGGGRLFLRPLRGEHVRPRLGGHHALRPGGRRAGDPRERSAARVAGRDDAEPAAPVCGLRSRRSGRHPGRSQEQAGPPRGPLAVCRTRAGRCVQGRPPRRVAVGRQEAHPARRSRAMDGAPSVGPRGPVGPAHARAGRVLLRPQGVPGR